MIHGLADENFTAALYRPLEARLPAGALVTVQQVGRRGGSDDELLRFAAGLGRVVVTHDRKTLIAAAYRRIERGEPCLGVVIVRDPEGTGAAALIDDLELLFVAGQPDDFDSQV